ncbi:membrane protein insertion efficiency factor YidD [Candidatus Woesearchaeota archaeon]|nr:membrane protein insertion efficiency factor YidD [Candidatus Woesearchaeota archaeon]
MVRIHVNGNCCCACCAGLALGYFLFGGPAHCEELEPTHPESLEQSVIDQEEGSFLLKQIGNYQRNISPGLHASAGTDQICKFEPSCSEYAREAILKHGQAKGTMKALARLARCNPLNKGGYDPV